MINIIKELYNLKIDKLYKNVFFYKDEKIKIIEFEKSEINKNKINNLANITNNLFWNRINVSTFLKNKNNDFYFEKKEKYYSLIKVNEREINVNKNDLIKIKINNELEEYNILKKIIDQTTLVEKDVIENENKTIRESINYFAGLADNSIALLNEYNGENNYICRNIILNEYNKEEFNNPVNFIKINYTYDISIYIKNKFYTKEIDYNEINDILKKISNENDQIFLFSMMLYPNYYFELVEEKNEKKLIKIISEVNKYEELLLFIKNIYRNNTFIKKINWLK